MRVAFRVDASMLIGSGHVMRCLTLADALKAQGADCDFISRTHPGNLLELIRQRGFGCTALPNTSPSPAPWADIGIPGGQVEAPVHAPWLGCDWQTDAQQTGAILENLKPDWLVVDHYALDEQWEAALQGHYRKLMVIDDLADRPHRCDVLLDNNLGRALQDYAHLVPDQCRVLAGPQYALLRPEFSALRPYSLQRRRQPALRRLLVTMGGVDQPNATGQVLEVLKGCSLPEDCRISVVMGLHAPWLKEVQALAQEMPWPTEVLVNISDMAQCMAEADLSIGAAGSTSWERCCLGLPTLMVVLADNQWAGARALAAAQAARLIGEVRDIEEGLKFAVEAITRPDRMTQMSAAASTLADGSGTEKVLRILRGLND